MPTPLQESATGVFNIPEDEPFIVCKMIEFLYTSTYDFTSHNLLSQHFQLSEDCTKSRGVEPSSDAEQSTPPTDELPINDAESVHAKVYAIADRYDIPSLKQYAVHKYVKQATNSLKLGQYNPFITSIPFLYENIMQFDTKLQQRGLGLIHDYRQSLMKQTEFIDMLTENPGIAMDIMKAFNGSGVTGLQGPRRIGFECKKCIEGVRCPFCQISKTFYSVAKDEVFDAQSGKPLATFICCVDRLCKETFDVSIIRASCGCEYDSGKGEEFEKPYHANQY